MSMPTIKDLVKVGAHFGHKKDKTNPKAKDAYIFGIKDGIYIIDLEKTQTMLVDAIKSLESMLKEGKTVLFVGSKRQVKDAVKNAAIEIGMPYINFRWLGGTLTNFSTVSASIKKLKDYEAKKDTDEYKNLTKQEQSMFDKKLEKMQQSLGGIKNITKLPDALFVVGTEKERVAIAEAKTMNIPIFAICDADANPEVIDYVIPANDDSRPTIELIMSTIAKKLAKK